MPANSWAEDDSYNELEALNSLLSDLSDKEKETPESFSVMSLKSSYAGRRRKAALVLTVIWGGTIALHLVSWGSWFVLAMTTLYGIHALRIVFARPHLTSTLAAESLAFPFVSLLVAAKNEEAVIANLVKTLCNQDYPHDKYEVWVIDDNSTDKTPEILAQMAGKYNHLRVLRRAESASGGKSGALNQVLPLTKGEILAVFDADAQVAPNLLKQVLPLFAQSKVGAVQVRKAIANATENFWTQGQAAEMALDTFVQQQRVALGGIGELRGNGQFVRRTALERCGGWNEETITDDLDLTFRLHLDQWDIECVSNCAVEEEGVTSAIALWHQRNRWAEGGYQRYLDYWRLIASNQMGTRKTFDLFMFLLAQYLLPTAQVPDLLMALARNRLPVLSPITTLAMAMSMVWMFRGIKQEAESLGCGSAVLENNAGAQSLGCSFASPKALQEGEATPHFFRSPKAFQEGAQKNPLSTFFVVMLQTLRGTFYMLHWLVVMTSTTARMSVRPKRLKWVKTVHQGTEELGARG